MAEKEELRLIQAPGKSRGVTLVLLFSIFSAVIGSALSLGYNTTNLNNPQEYIQDFIYQSHLSQTGEEWSSSKVQNIFAFTVSVFCLAGPVGAIGGPYLASKFGRKTVMLGNNVLLIVGVLFSSFCVSADSYQMLIVGRAISGVNVGVNTGVCPMYLSEIAPKEIRGGVGVCFQLTVTVGAFLGQLLSFNSILGSKELWPELFNILLVFGFIQCALLPFCPESPRYLLIEAGSREAGVAALQSLRGAEANIEEELQEIEEDDQKQKSEPEVTWGELITTGHLRRPLIIAVVMVCSQQLSGVNGVSVYSSPIFRSATSGSEDVVNVMVALTGLTLIVFAAVSVPVIDRVGRKAMHLIGMAGMGISSLIIAILLSNVPTDDSQTCHGIAFSSTANYFATGFVFVYFASFSLGPGSIPWLLAPELFTEGARPKAVSIAVTANWLSNFSVQYLFPIVQQQLCGWVFLIFFGILLVLFVYLWIRLPEVSGMTTQDISELFKDGIRRKSTGRYTHNSMNSDA